MSEYEKLSVLPYAQRFGLTPQLAYLMKALHEAETLVTNEDMKDALLMGQRGMDKKRTRIVDMSVYRLRKCLSPFDIGIKRIENFGAYFTDEDKKRISHALAGFQPA